ncbi:TIGR03118 family protein [Streptantibioticus ferralitis]|uniref:TIGR03118 family protein n=1 Tax=Streptantibioticus ferralitis TaxID=236510 RepID=A0ABT5YYG1_9ACTN|nr:TIGR03118 family protein [Streptantibioticus ferralitis]MDF2256580.1 TIGR03118 family protein [Streptantibioticus ferralitis]
MAHQVSVRHRRSRSKRLVTVAITLSALGAVALTAPAASGQPSHRRDRGYREFDFVSNVPGRAAATDPNLVNPWGLSQLHGAVWVSDNGSDKATAYTGARPGKPARVLPRVVSIPGAGAPTGNARNDTSGFRFHAFGRSGAARLVFSGEEGDLFAWSPRVSRRTAVRVAHTETGGVNAVYKGLALVPFHSKWSASRRHRHHPRLLVADFRDARIDVFDGRFHRLPSHGRFRDPSIPSGFAPFNVRVFGPRVFVTYAKQDPAKHDDVAGAGNGFIDVFDLHGRLLRHFARRGVLNSPWGMELAPRDFGRFSGDLLVGNFGDGHIHAFNPRTGRLMGTLKDAKGKPITIPGLWGLLRGTHKARQDAVWFAAGINGEQDGLLGIVRANY